MHPGETLREALDERGMDQRTLAHLTGFSEKHVSEFVNGRTGIGVEFAVALEEALGIDARVWMNLQTDYDLHAYRVEASS